MNSLILSREFVKVVREHRVADIFDICTIEKPTNEEISKSCTDRCEKKRLFLLKKQNKQEKPEKDDDCVAQCEDKKLFRLAMRKIFKDEQIDFKALINECNFEDEDENEDADDEDEE